MRPLTRRQLLALGAAGAGATAVGGAGLWLTTGPGTGSGHTGGEDLTEPQLLASRDRVLELDLTAAPARVRVGGQEANVQAFNGSLPGPTLRVRAGDTIRITMRNGLQAPTNLHVHGLHVSPQSNSDNPFVSIDPGGSFDYEFTLPGAHPPGTYWYHPHRHGHVAGQVAAGLYGAIVVEDPDAVPVTRERVLVVSDLSLDADGNLAQPDWMQQMMGREGQIVLVNGQLRPQLRAAPGERERWRIINACSSRYLRLALDGQQLRLLSRDLGRLPVPEDVTEVVLAPGNRVELLVETRDGSSTLTAAPVDRGSMNAMMGGGNQSGSGPVDLLSLAVSGSAGTDPGPVPEGRPLRDLRNEPVTAARTLNFAMGMNANTGMNGNMGSGTGMGSMMAFTINGRKFDPERVDETAAAGTVEEWTLTNSSPMDHPIHLHVWPMQVIQDGDRDVTKPTWQDVVNVPARSRVKVRVAFNDFPGRTVIHCHILDHEDQGMMATVQAR
ncbi:multicopper oxidase family protein [Pseudarthrobacter sp. AG30]|uniref:multicopper oxidase family protein n=1 Tax=Pseudarthrobacter sp. AG30 TaxID=2249742 RepID=UPI000D6DF135|nr:multicopper oxidase family protein [Pseudarthrobacter sp. AG30]RAX15067.1 multicopper oxidase family protein [Pseudarthrobacter sp. AG30]